VVAKGVLRLFQSNLAGTGVCSPQRGHLPQLWDQEANMRSGVAVVYTPLHRGNIHHEGGATLWHVNEEVET
jgi:hypothetical protein